MIDNEHAIEVIELMLHHTRIELRETTLLHVPLEVEVAYEHRLRSRHLTPHARQTQAPFLVPGRLRREREDFGIDERRQLIPHNSQKEPLTDANLRRSQALTISGNHRFGHVTQQALQLFRDLRHSHSELTEDGSIGANDERQGGDGPMVRETLLPGNA
jgi:hypothetical protein